MTTRRAIVSVLWGKQKGLKAPIPPGATLRVGRTERADLVVPNDTKLSGVHFELRWDGERCHLQDLGSALGTELGGQRVSVGAVPHGGWIRAGETDFGVHFEGATPPPEPDVYGPDYEPEPPGAAAARAGALEVLRAAAAEGPLYAVLDASRDERVLTLLREAVDESRSLYEGLAGEPLADVAPYLVRFEPDSRLLEALIAEGWGKRWGFFAACSAPLREVRRHLRRFLVVRNEETGGRMYFRYYDPGVLRVFLGASTPLQASELFGPLRAIWLEGPRREIVHLPAPLHGRRCLVSSAPAELTRALEAAARRNLVVRLGEATTLSVRRFAVREAVSRLFEVSLELASPDPDLDFGAIVGLPASLRVVGADPLRPAGATRVWAGVCSHLEQLRVEREGLSTYACRIVPTLWLLGLRRDHRIFQHLSVPEIVERVLERWKIAPVFRLERSAFAPLPYKVQYAETDLAFLLRITEEAGVAITFTGDEDGARPVFHDALGTEGRREAPPIRDVGPTEAWASEGEQASHVRIAHRLRPGSVVLRDVDLRRPREGVFGTARDARAPEARLEQFFYEPGSFLVDVPGADARATPTADDRGASRHDDAAGQALAARALAALRSDARVIAFETNVHELAPGVICALDTPPRADLAEEPPLLVVSSALAGRHDGDWAHTVEVVRADVAFRPPRRAPKPRLVGVQSAMVVGPRGEEIHVDELGRVRVQFPWDREGRADEESSCWVPVSQGWAGAGYGMTAIPRIGHEVLVAFVEGDPDDPVIVGRMYNATAPVPHALPGLGTVSTWKSDASPGSDGFHEIRFEDRKTEELVYVQSERNMRRLVKHDETITVGHDLEDRVEGRQEETTRGLRTEVTHARRKATTYGSQITDLRANEQKLVAGAELEDSRSDRRVLVRGDADAVTHGSKRERVGGNMHADVVGSRAEHVGGAHSLTVVESDQTEVSGTYALEAGATVHFVAGEGLVGEAGDLTLKGPGGFVRIDASGVTIGGTIVRINTPGRSRAGRPVRPQTPSRADVPPVLPEDEEDATR